MNLNEIVRPAHDHPSTPARREFLRKTLTLSTLSLTAALPAGTLFAAVRSFQAPTRTRGSASRNIRDYGALGNGSHDDTIAFQNAIDSLPSDGGTVIVPAGSYLIDPLRSVWLRNRMHLRLDPDARLVAKPNGSDQYNIVIADRVNDVEISGGEIVGERDSHQGTTGEGGHGINIRGCSRVTIRDIRISKCWGDGIHLGPKAVYQAPLVMARDIAIVGAVCVGNRRNALSITNVINADVWDSEFSGTYGTKPECGIAIEPNEDRHGSNGYCDKIHIENCIMADNAECGLQIWKRAKGVSARNCVMRNNTCSGIFTEAAERVLLVGNEISRSGQNGAAIRKYSENFRIYNNTFYENYTNLGIKVREPFYLTGTSPKVERDILVSSTGTTVEVGRNYYR